MGSSCSLPTLPVPISRSLWCAFLLLDLGDGVLDLDLVRELSERGEHGYAALMCIATLISVGAGVLFGRYSHALMKAHTAAQTDPDYAATAAAVATFTLACGELLSFGVEDSTTLYILANVDGLYAGAGESGFSADLNLLTTGLSSLAVLALLVFGAGKLILGREGSFGEVAVLGVTTLLLAAVVAYFTAVATALYTQANANPLAPDTLDPYAMTTAYVFAWLLASVCGCFLLFMVGDVADGDDKEKVHARFTVAALGRFFSCQNLDADGTSGSSSV